ncbi:methyl-accepting chemotaxis protein [Alkalihalobacterium alkalinitrilicum]|uniref:methyl-accepting chemotaxis protein n=1 Tax=Alkalihalobacterium alkalinitrilicum TaxID=427920 RepID=UPI0009954E02|nr:methyl-accepting chemotaxis protein [Alkalihalobacterium alkalinitrilicum]
MYLWRNLKIKNKLFILFSIVLIFFIVGFYLVFFQINSVNSEINNLETNSETNLLVMELMSNIDNKFIAIMDFDQNRRINMEQYNERNERLDYILNLIDNEMVTEKQQQLFEEYITLHEFFQFITETIVNSPAPSTDREYFHRLNEISDLSMLKNSMYLHLQDFNNLLSNQLQDAKTNAQSAIQKTKLILVSSLIVSVIGGTILIVLFSNTLTKSLKQVVNISERISKGDLTVDKISVRSKDEIGRLSYSMNHMVDSLRSLVQKILLTSEQVAASSEELTASSNETGKALLQISASIQQISVGATEQLNSATNANIIAEDMNKYINEINNSVQTVFKSSDKTVNHAEKGNKTMKSTVDQMKVISEKANATGIILGQLENKSNEINQILSLITEVSDRTNLLAINAAIEAVRAGKHGNGFAVVADEVRKLANQSKNAAKQISDLIYAIQEDVKSSVSSMKEGHTSVEQGIKLINEAENTFADITKDIGNVLQQTEDVTKLVENVASGAEVMSATIDETRHITEKSVEHTQVVAKSAVGQSSSMQEIVSAAEILAGMAEDLQRNISKFTL